MLDKRVTTTAEALAGLEDGASIMISGFGGAGTPVALIQALAAHPARQLTLIANSLRYVESYAPNIFVDRRVVTGITSSARASGRETAAFERQWLDGDLSIELVPQGTFVERIRAGGAGIAGFYTPTGAGTKLGEGKEVREFDGKPHLLERALTADFAFIRAFQADRWGNIGFRGSQANFGPAMASAARVAVVEVEQLTEEPLPPHSIGIPGIFVQRVIQLPDPRDDRES